MRASELLADFLGELGYDIKIKKFPIIDGSSLDLIVFTKKRDGRVPSSLLTNLSDPDSWCIIRAHNYDVRPACTITIDAMHHQTKPFSSITLFFDDPGLFPQLTAYLDHWYFRIFQRD